MPPTDLLLGAAVDADRYAGMTQRHAIERQLRANEIERVRREDGTRERPWTRLVARLRPDHSLTPYPCRLPGGDLGRTAIKSVNGEWTAVCVPAGGLARRRGDVRSRR
jgi:hypothetical protein